MSSIFSNSKVETAGDPRIDQVYNISNKENIIEGVDSFIDNKKVIIGGSTYNKENQFIKRYINDKEIKVLIAPIFFARGDKLLQRFKISFLYGIVIFKP